MNTQDTAVDVDSGRTRAREALDAARQRTLALTDCLDDADLCAQHSPLMSPLVWDLAHVGNLEEIYIVRGVGARPAIRPDLDGLYDAFEHPRAERIELPLLRPGEAREYIAEVRAQTMKVLDKVVLDGDPALAGVFAFVAQHEAQHAETMLATHQLRLGPPVLVAPEPEPAEPDDADDLPSEIVVPEGPFTMGTSTDPWALDNERPDFTVDVPAFRLDTAPVTNAAFQVFITHGGYDDPRWWTTEGWDLRQREDLRAPLYWYRHQDAWWRRRFGRFEPVPGDEPVVHVCWHEAEAYASWAGRRLPTEAEWEKAARYDTLTGTTLRNPWGDQDVDPDRANIWPRYLQPSPVGSQRAGFAPSGAQHLLGDVWEWTASDFTAYPGFRAHPDEAYSEVFFGTKYKVLRGGSFATDPMACRATFRNWDLPVRRQIFAGFRTAADDD
jgi:iron(II)-dependent oxidoreductase